MVMFTTDSITKILGYPKDMWVGRSFIDFVHHKDRGTFTGQITSGISLPFGDQLKVGWFRCIVYGLPKRCILSNVPIFIL